MKLIIKKAFALLLSGIMLLSLAACSAKTPASGEGASTGSATASAINREAPAVKIGETVITAGDVQDQYDYLVSMYSYYYGMPEPTADADVESLQNEAVAGLIEGPRLLYWAGKLGYDVLSAEQEAKLAEELSMQVEDIISYYSEDAEVEGTDEDIRSAALEKLNEEVIAAGFESFDNYCAMLEEQMRKTMIITNLEEAIKSTATVSEDEVKAYYDTLYESQKTMLEDPTQYLSRQESYEMMGGEPMLLAPEGYVRVKVLSVMPEGALDESYGALLSEMAELEAEYGNLSLAASTDTARTQQIKEQYAEKKAESDRMFEEYTASARAKINEAYGKLQAGESFDAVFTAYNEDTTYTDYPVFAERGRLMMPGQDDGAWDENLHKAAAGLSVGQYSNIVEIEGSYYIVYLMSEEPAGDIPYASVSEAMHTLALEQAQNTVWEQQQEDWEADSSMITYYEDAYRMIGKAS